MKKQILQLILGLGYMGLLILLLLSQFSGMIDTAKTWKAVLDAVVIGVPWLIILKLYNLMSQKPIPQKKQKSSQTVKIPTGQENGRAVEGQSDEEILQEIETRIRQGSVRDIHVLFETVVQEYSLTGREQEVAWLLYRGYTNRQIGEELFITETTVKKHASHIYEKVQVMSRKEFRKKIDHDLRTKQSVI